jgi:hypothetical protein
MSLNILQLGQQQFNTRIAFGGCILNLNGETYDVTVTRNVENRSSPTYSVEDKETKKRLCTFRAYHLSNLDPAGTMYQIEGVSQSGGDGTLIVPLHGLFKEAVDEDDDA